MGKTTEMVRHGDSGYHGPVRVVWNEFSQDVFSTRQSAVTVSECSTSFDSPEEAAAYMKDTNRHTYRMYRTDRNPNAGLKEA